MAKQKFKSFKSMNDVQRYYYPTLTLDRLEKRIKNAYGIKRELSDCVKKDKVDFFQGVVSIPKIYSERYPDQKTLFDIVKKFYISESFGIISSKDSELLEVKKDKKTYLVLIQETKDNYVVQITAPIVKK